MMRRDVESLSEALLEAYPSEARLLDAQSKVLLVTENVPTADGTLYKLLCLDCAAAGEELAAFKSKRSSELKHLDVLFQTCSQTAKFSSREWSSSAVPFVPVHQRCIRF